MCVQGGGSVATGEERPAHVKVGNTLGKGEALERGGLITQSPSVGDPQDPGARSTEGVPSFCHPPPLRSPTLRELPPLFQPPEDLPGARAPVYKTEVEQIL